MPTSILSIAMSALLFALSPFGGDWKPASVEPGSHVLFITAPLLMMAAAWIFLNMTKTFGQFDVLIAVVIAVAVLPHPLMWALKSACTPQMTAIVFLALSALTGVLFGSAASDVSMLYAEIRAGRSDVSSCLSVGLLGAVVPCGLFWASSRVWWQAPLWYITCLALVTVIAIVASDAPDE